MQWWNRQTNLHQFQLQQYATRAPQVAEGGIAQNGQRINYSTVRDAINRHGNGSYVVDVTYADGSGHVMYAFRDNIGTVITNWDRSPIRSFVVVFLHP
jgi:hypothetical protein